MKSKKKIIKIPVSSSLSLLKEMKKNEANNMCDHELPVIWNKAEEFKIYDKYGNEWIDFTSGIFVTNVGHCAKEVKDAVLNKVKNKLIHSYVFPNKSRIELAKKLIKITKLDKVLFTVTGSEANDAAIQMMQRNKKGKILTIKGAYYGSTVACRSILKNSIDESILPNTSFNPSKISGIFLQAFRGRDADFMPYDWIRSWCSWAQKNNIPVGFDEMQSGFARTGKWFGYQHYNIKPDFITIGKALGGGLPISAVVGKNKLLNLSEDLWSTHSGNPLCCAAALAVLNIIEKKNLVKEAAKKGKLIKSLLEKSFPKNKVYGRGMIWALYTGDKEITQKIIKKCAEKGLLLVSTYGMAIKIGPPLIMPKEYLSKGIKILKESFDLVINN